MTFQPGNKFGKGRPKSSPNKNIRERALTGLARGGANKAKKAGKNGAVDGLTYFFEDLAEKNSSAAASLAGKLISSEPPPDKSGITPGVILNIVSAAQGTSFSPGNVTLLPFEVADIVWKAFKGGDVSWKAYLKANEALFTAAAFEKLSVLEAPEPKSDIVNEAPRLLAAPVDQEFTPQTERERRLLEELEALSPEELLERAKQAGYIDVDGN